MSKTHRILTPRLIFSITAGAPYFSLNSGGPDDLHRFHCPLGGPEKNYRKTFNYG